MAVKRNNNVSLRRRTLILTVVFTLSTTAARSQQFSSQPPSLIIDSVTKQVTSGGEVKISTKLTITSEKPVVLEDGGIFWHLDVLNHHYF
jgi:hypothetical protein